ncbi:hypothetical protein BD413DRAFT_720192 [Trametes elegans]|nr:hypothetical protein BD413DRAFT_720192 [Trametes elegans]
MCFDYCLTFTREVQRIWTLGFSMSAVLFYGVRYPAVFSTLFVVLDMTQWHGISDSVLFSALRAYALCMGNPRVLVLVLVFGLVQPIISLYTFIQSYTGYIFWPIPSCGFGSAIPQVKFENRTCPFC